MASQRSGTGVPLVFIHAFPLSSRMWDGTREILTKNFQFITVDLPGFGTSPLLSDTSKMESMAEEVVRTLDEMKVNGQIIFAGLSMGGYVMLQILRMIPDRVRAAAFLSTRSAPDSPEAREKRFKIIEGIEREGIKFLSERMITSLFGKSTLSANPLLVNEVRGWIESANPKAVCAALRGMAARPDMTNLLPTLEFPTLVIAGEEDTVVPPAEMEEMSKKLPNAEFHKLPQAGHLINLEKPKEFHDIFLHFLKRHVL